MVFEPVSTMVIRHQIDPVVIVNEIMRANQRLDQLITKLDFDNDEHRQVILQNHELIMQMYQRLEEVVK